MVSTYSHPQFGTIKLGKLKPRIDPRTPKLKTYLKRLPSVASEVSWVMEPQTWPMYLNDQIGDCVAAAAGHMIDQWTRYAGGTEVLLTNQQILKTYEDVGGYVPGDPNTDNGMYMLSYLQYWQKTGVGGHKIQGFVTVDPTDLDEVFSAIELLGNVYLGLALPISAQTQSAWTVGLGGPNAGGDNAPGSWGGHCVPVMAASPHSRTCITWGQRLKMSPNFFRDYVDEAYAVLSPDWIGVKGVSPSDLDLAALQSDLAAL